MGLDEAAYLKQHKGIYKNLYRLLENKPGLKILDIGCATGIAYKNLPNREQYKISGLDYVPEFVSVLVERGIDGKLCDINKEDFPFSDGEFDVVVCTGIIEHSLAPAHLLKESTRVLKSGGTLMLSTPNALSITKRWNYLRGRNQFWPLIDNLFNQTYLKRCAIFYSQHDLKKVLPKDLVIERIKFIDEINSLWRPSLFGMLAKLAPSSMKDTLILFAKKILKS